jgi:hypothetical protein
MSAKLEWKERMLEFCTRKGISTQLLIRDSDRMRHAASKSTH